MDKGNKNKNKPATNGLANLSEESENMRMEVVELELKARYWKAQHDIRFYTLAAEKIQPEYDQYITTARENQEKMLKDLQEEIRKRGDGQLHIDEEGNTLPEDGKVEEGGNESQVPEPEYDGKNGIENLPEDEEEKTEDKEEDDKDDNVHSGGHQGGI